MKIYVVTYNIYDDGKIVGGGLHVKDDLRELLSAFQEEFSKNQVLADIRIKEIEAD